MISYADPSSVQAPYNPTRPRIHFVHASFFVLGGLKEASFFRPTKTKKPRCFAPGPCWVAETEGFEPPVPRGTMVFKTTAFDHSATSPGQRYKREFDSQSAFLGSNDPFFLQFCISGFRLKEFFSFPGLHWFFIFFMVMKAKWPPSTC